MQTILVSLFFFLPFFYLFILFFRPISSINEDLGRHLLLGKIITQTHTVPKTNLLSYTYPDSPFINSHWFSEVIFYSVFRQFGFNGLLLLSTGITLLSFFLIFWLAYKRSSFPACL